MATGRLEDKVAIVTGGGAGIGRGIARALGDEGAAVAVAGRTLSKCQDVADEITAAGGRAIALECDVNDRSQIDRSVAATAEAFGSPSILVNNAHGGPMSPEPPVEELTEERCYAAWRGSFLASLYGMQAVFPAMKEAGGGSIVNVVSQVGIVGEPLYGGYGSAKESVRALTRHAARGWGQYGIRVNAIAPTAYNQRLEKARDDFSPFLQSVVDRIPLGYLGEAYDDIGRAVLALVTDLRYVTGSTLTLDGGLCVLR